MPPQRQDIARSSAIVSVAFLLGMATLTNAATSATTYQCQDAFEACFANEKCAACLLPDASDIGSSPECESYQGVDAVCESLGSVQCCVVQWTEEDGCLTNSLVLAYWDCLMPSYDGYDCSLDDLPCLDDGSDVGSLGSSNAVRRGGLSQGAFQLAGALALVVAGIGSFW